MDDVTISLVLALHDATADEGLKNVTTTLLSDQLRREPDEVLEALLHSDWPSVVRLVQATDHVGRLLDDSPPSTTWEYLDQRLSEASPDVLRLFFIPSFQVLDSLPRTLAALESGKFAPLTWSDLPSPQYDHVISNIFTSRAARGDVLGLSDVQELYRRGWMHPHEPRTHPRDADAHEPHPWDADFRSTVSDEAGDFLWDHEAWALLLSLDTSSATRHRVLAHARYHPESAAAVISDTAARQNPDDEVTALVEEWLARDNQPLPAALVRVTHLVVGHRLVRGFAATITALEHAFSATGPLPLPHFTNPVAPLLPWFSQDPGYELGPGELTHGAERLRAAQLQASLHQTLLLSRVPSTSPLFLEWVDLCWANGASYHTLEDADSVRGIIPLLLQGLGESPEALSTFFGLLGSWTLSFSQLLTTARELGPRRRGHEQDD